MFRTTKLYPCMAVVLAVICVIFLSNCGGGGNSSVVPNTNPTTENPVSYTNPTPTPILVTKPAEGYLLVTNSITDEGDNVENLKVFDVPAFKVDTSGNQPFIQQVADTLKEDPQTWNSPQIQELYSALNASLFNSRPLPLYASSANLYSSYQDSENSEPIPVNADGSFNSQVLTEAGNSSTELEVVINEDTCLEAETVTSGDISSSCNDTTPGLKSSPSKIMVMPGEVVEVLIYSYPTTNLKNAGLTITLNDTSLGCISPQIFLCKGGKKDYTKAWVCFHAKKSLSTPISTTITVKTSDLQLEIPVEIVKAAASISGTVYTGGATLVKGFVKSFGPKSHCKLDENGNYTLQKVFKAHNVKVRATWWTIGEDGKKIRHREVRVIDFLNADLTGFNFGVPPTPTSTPSVTPTPRPLNDEFYSEKVGAVLSQYEQWKTEAGVIQAIQHTMQWLNGELLDGPPIPDEISGAVSVGNPDDIWIMFRDGMSICISTSDPIIIEEENAEEPLPREEVKPITHLTAASSNNTTVKNADVIMLSPSYWEQPGTYRVEKDILEDLKNNDYKVKCITTEKPEDISLNWGFFPANLVHLVTCKILNWDNIVTPMTFETIGKYGIIYINAHGGPVNIAEKDFDPTNVPKTAVFRMSCTVLDSTLFHMDPIWMWMERNKGRMYDYTNEGGWWFYRYREIKDTILTSTPREGWIGELALTNHYFDYLNSKTETNFDGSLIYWGDCYTWHMRDSFNTAKVYIGNTKSAKAKWAYPFAYDFFWFMMYGTKDCPKDLINNDGSLAIPNSPKPAGTPTFDEDKPLDARHALHVLTTYYNVNPDPATYTDEESLHCNDCTVLIQYDSGEHIYFPVPVTVTVHKK